MQAKKQQLESDMGQWAGSKFGKEYKGVYCHPAYSTYMHSTSCKMLLDETQAGVRIARRNISNLKYADDTTLMAEKQEELKSVLINLKD